MTAHDGNLEARLRGALSARAAAVTAGDLQPAVPPTVAAGRRLRRLPWRWPRLLTGAAVAGVAAVALVAWLPGEKRETPAPNPPAATVPASPPASSVPVSPTPEATVGRSKAVPEATIGRDGLPKGVPATPQGSPTASTSAPRTAVPSRRGIVPSPPASFG